MYPPHKGRSSRMQEDKRYPDSWGRLSCSLVSRAPHESGAPWDSRSLLAKAGYTSASSAVAMATDAQAFTLPPCTFCPPLFLHLIAPPRCSQRAAIVLVPPSPTFQPLWFETGARRKLVMAFSEACCSMANLTAESGKKQPKHVFASFKCLPGCSICDF